MADEQAAGNAEQPQQQFALQRIYTKDISVESPATPGVFRKQWQPQVNVDLGTKSEKIDETGNFEVVLTITITAKLEVIEGQPPIMKAPPAACAFRPRCAKAMERCARENPLRTPVGEGHDVACFWDARTGGPRHA